VVNNDSEAGVLNAARACHIRCSYPDPRAVRARAGSCLLGW